MSSPNLGWQSWSPSTPSLAKLPLWDYDPLLQNKPPNLKKPIYSPKSPISLWCSWHMNGVEINEKLILDQAEKFRHHKYVPQYILIDDGWCRWGDWTIPSRTKFPGGIASLTKKLQKHTYQTGLWLAPFLIDPKSRLAQTHPNWLIKDRFGKPFNGFASYPLIRELTPKYLLDFTQPEAFDYLLDCFNTIISIWGITLLKLDHLYAPYFAPSATQSELAEKTLIRLFTHLKQKYPHVYIIACGCPFAPAQDLVDAIRFSKDINSPSLKHFPPLNYILYRKRKGLLEKKLAITRQLAPLPFGLDPDAAITWQDADRYYQLWKKGIIQVFGLGYNL